MLRRSNDCLFPATHIDSSSSNYINNQKLLQAGIRRKVFLEREGHSAGRHMAITQHDTSSCRGQPRQLPSTLNESHAWRLTSYSVEPGSGSTVTVLLAAL